MKCGDIKTIPRPVRSIITFSNFARNWNETHPARCISARYTAWDTSSFADLVLNSYPVYARTTNQTEPATALLPRLRLRTRFLLSMLVITAGLTTTSLLVVRHSVQSNVRRDIVESLRDSVSTFQNFLEERENMLTLIVKLQSNLT